MNKKSQPKCNRPTSHLKVSTIVSGRFDCGKKCRKSKVKSHKLRTNDQDYSVCEQYKLSDKSAMAEEPLRPMEWVAFAIGH